MMQASTPEETSESAVRTRALAHVASPATAELLQSLSDLMRTVRRLKALTGGGTPLLMWLAHEGPRRARDLAEAFDLDQSTVSRHISALEAEGLVVRTPSDDDRRAHVLEITAAGQTSVEAGMRARAAIFEAAIADWPEHDVTELTRLLSSFAAAIEAATVPT